ncbi:hypothetical protein [Ornithobacterium rhinotracheale]|uniref:hypothetical protein n=1 Tax=Ornithobacterium rhinotracheale TaxID=28251 RepID=UPI001FF111D9|nr:hypothetical protein [Ornithobacterium rhinotracheale]MCK0201315.1 hypothetical protein [Ornithobacterium rhinotracheale]
MDTKIHELMSDFIENKGLSRRDFAKKIGEGQSKINGILKHGTNFQISLLFNINEKYPDFLDKVLIPAFSRNEGLTEGNAKDKLIELLERDNKRLLEENDKLKKKLKRTKKGVQTNVESNVEQSF